MSHPLEAIRPRSLKHLTQHLYGLMRERLWLKVIVAMVLGIAVGILLSPSMGFLSEGPASIVGNWIALPGKIFLALIQMIVVPLVFASVITGLASSEDVSQLRRMGVRVVIYFLLTSTVAIGIGIAVGSIIQLGRFIDSSMLDISMNNPPAGTAGEMEPIGIAGIPEAVANLIPDNPLGSMVSGEMLQVVLFAIVFGLALVVMPTDSSKPLLKLLESVQEVCMTVVRWAMKLAPFAVFGLLAQIAIKVGLDALAGMAVYVATVLLGLLVLLLFYLAIVWLVGRRSPVWFLSRVRDVQLLGFSTSSSAAVMPLSMRTAEEKLEVRPSVAQFLIPLGATINMDGTALYQGVAAVFLTQAFGVALTPAQMILVVVTAVGASIGSPATPGVGIIILSMVARSVGVPPAGVALIIGVDRILDMSRTALNVTGDLTASVVMERWIGGESVTSKQPKTSGSKRIGASQEQVIPT